MMWRTITALVVRPSLWPTAVGAALALAPRGWWRTAPFLPIPDREVMAWRVTTAYGRPDMALAPEDIVSYLEWRQRA